MAEHGWSTDRVLGIAGVTTAVAVMALSITALANPDVGEWLQTAASIAGYLVFGALVGLTIRHWRLYPHGEGRQRFVGAWVLFGMVLGWALLMSIDSAIEGSFADWLPALDELGAGLAFMVPLPLAVAALGTLRDVRDRPDYRAAPPPTASTA